MRKQRGTTKGRPQTFPGATSASAGALLLGERPREGRQSELFEPLRICFAFRCEINNRISQSSSGCLLIAVNAACDDSIPGRIERSFEDGKRFRTEAFAITAEGHGRDPADSLAWVTIIPARCGPKRPRNRYAKTREIV